MDATRFEGWPDEALEFFAGLEADNSRAYWQANKPVYEASVRAPMLALLDELAPRYGTFHLFRPNRELRFSRDKSPYKTAIAAVTEGEGGESYYVQLSTEGLLAGVGCYYFARDQLEAYRRAVDAARSGNALARLLTELTQQGFTVGGQALKTAPRGFPRDHPRVALLRHKGLYVSRPHPPGAWLATRAAVGRVTGAWDDAAPLARWLARQVGPSTEPPPEAS